MVKEYVLIDDVVVAVVMFAFGYFVVVDGDEIETGFHRVGHGDAGAMIRKKHNTFMYIPITNFYLYKKIYN